MASTAAVNPAPLTAPVKTVAPVTGPMVVAVIGNTTSPMVELKTVVVPLMVSISCC
jgi:hypothetical protein